MTNKKKALSKSSEEIATDRYFLHPEEGWYDCTLRSAIAGSSPETTHQAKYRDAFHELIYNQDFMPGGRILRNSGKSRGSLFNCYHLPVGDSIEEIGQLIKDSLILWSDGGGVGVNFSPLRPKNADILGKGGKSSGLVSFIEATDGAARTIESGGGRRAAAIATVEVSHPEIMDFIDAKIIHGKLSCFNISVAINEDFLMAVERDSEWEFKFREKSCGKVPARIIWDKIVENMINHAEPGLLNWNNFQKNNSYYFAPVTGTNPCGETTLEPYGVCNLGSFVLPNFITGSVNTNWKKLENSVRLAVRFLDNIIESNKYSIKQIDINAHRSRRVGIGVLGVADYFFAKGLRYGSEKSVQELEKLMRFIRDVAYSASIEIAMEKGAFPAFDPIPYSKASFIRKLPASLRMDIKRHGIRNTTLMAIAPTGTISLVADCCSGLEPLFSKAYMRRDRVSDRMYVHPVYEKCLRSGDEVPDWLVDSFDLQTKDHFEIQCAVQKYVDGSVSKTINMPRESTTDDLSKLLLEYIYDLKGVTVYRDGCREGQPLNQATEEEVREYLKENETTNFLSSEDVQCASGSCEI